jgi:hypothetical protein
VESAAFDADVLFVAVSFCMSVLLTSCAFDDICFIGVWRFYYYNSVLNTCYVVDFFYLGRFLGLRRIGSVVLYGFVKDIDDISDSVS